MPDKTKECSKTKWNRDNWPIAAAMNGFSGVLPDGSLVQDQPADHWAATLQQVVDAGFTASFWGRASSKAASSVKSLRSRSSGVSRDGRPTIARMVKTNWPPRTSVTVWLGRLT